MSMACQLFRLTFVFHLCMIYRTSPWNISFVICWNLVESTLCGWGCLVLHFLELGSGMVLVQVLGVIWTTYLVLAGLVQLMPKKVRTGNNLLRVSLRFLEICQQLRTPYALENPRTSYAWSMPSMKRFIASHQPSLCFLDFCQYGEEWRKPTTIMGNFWPVHQISRTCEPHHGLCSQTNRPHFALAGTDEHNVFWTLRAQPYPRALCDAVASVVAKSLA